MLWKWIGCEGAGGLFFYCLKTGKAGVLSDSGDGRNGNDWSYVKKKYKLNMPFLVLSYPAKASALLSNAA